MARDTVISYQSKDAAAAEAIRDALEAAGITCWMAPRDITAGSAWSSAIVEAIEESKVLVLVASSNAFGSRQVAREMERADSKGKLIIPVMLEPTPLTEDFAYYLGRVQQFSAHPAPLETYLSPLVETVRRMMSRGAAPSLTQAPPNGPATVDEMLALGRAICHDIREDLAKPAVAGDAETLSERQPGQTLNVIDVVSNRRARQTIAAWQQRRGHTVKLVGEDIASAVVPNSGEEIVVCLDGLDGTQHWLRGRNLYCTALSIFQRGEDNCYLLQASFVHHSDGTLFVAREDRAAAYIDGQGQPLRAHSSSAAQLADAHVCTVCRRPGHYEVLVPLLSNGSPFSGLYLFGGNPVLVEVPLGRYDALFQPDAAIFNDSQELWDWLAGVHIAYRTGCTVLDTHGNPVDVPALANMSFASGVSRFSYVVAGNAELAREIAAWLNAPRGR